MRQSWTLLSAAIMAVGVVIGGWFIGNGFAQGRRADRFVEVKGLAERNVRADLALWPLQFVTTSNDLSQAQATIERDIHLTYAFLARHGVDTGQVQRQNLQVTDVMANPYRQGPVTARYIVSQQLMVRSGKPETVLAASQQVGELVQSGVVLGGEGGPSSTSPTYLFTKLNDFKPAMIGEATANARAAAEKFAADSKSSLGGIRQANQGLFSILPRDQAPGISEESQIDKTIRLVSTVDYYLEH